jgi:hypothetical protein
MVTNQNPKCNAPNAATNARFSDVTGLRLAIRYGKIAVPSTNNEVTSISPLGEEYGDQKHHNQNAAGQDPPRFKPNQQASQIARLLLTAHG